MEMFDYVKFEWTLPDGSKGNEWHQTKSLGPNLLYRHAITDEGRLFIDCGHDVDVPIKERPQVYRGSDLIQLAGCRKHVQVLEEAEDFTGTVNFDWWIAVFVDGKLIAIRKERDS